MNDNLSFPPLRDLPPGHLEARKQHLLSEIAREPGRSRFRLATVSMFDRRRSWRGVLVVAAGVAALAGASVAIAAGLGAFNGIGAAQHPQTGADVIDAKTVAWLHEYGCGIERTSSGAIVPVACNIDSARFVSTLQSGLKVYVMTDTRGDLCVVVPGDGSSCGPALDAAHPITNVSENRTGSDFLAYGVAMDDVTAVSFTVAGHEVAVPVKDNVWAYEERSTASLNRCIVAHLADGSTVNPFPEVPCP